MIKEIESMKLCDVNYLTTADKVSQGLLTTDLQFNLPYASIIKKL